MTTRPADDHGQIVEKLDYLTSLFQRRLQEDRAKDQVIQAVVASLEERTKLDSGATYAALFQEALLAVDRLLTEAPSAELNESVADELLTVFGRRGLRRAPSEGLVDARIHEVAGTVPAGGDKGPGEIAHVERDGYLLGERVLRPARVHVVEAHDA